MNLDWIASPLWLLLNALAAYRLTRLWVADMLPPIPWLREGVEAWASERYDTQLHEARQLDKDDPAHQREVDEEKDRARRLFSNARWLPGQHEDRLQNRYRLWGGQHPVTYLVTCAWCSGYWIALAVFLAASLVPATVWAFLAVPLAFSAVTGLLHQAAEK